VGPSNRQPASQRCASVLAFCGAALQKTFAIVPYYTPFQLTARPGVAAEITRLSGYLSMNKRGRMHGRPSQLAPERKMHRYRFKFRKTKRVRPGMIRMGDFPQMSKRSRSRVLVCEATALIRPREAGHEIPWGFVGHLVEVWRNPTAGPSSSLNQTEKQRKQDSPKPQNKPNTTDQTPGE